MNDTTKLILWIALAAVALGLIIWIYVSSSRREKEARRIEAASLRARVEDRLPAVQGHEDRASVAETIASEARAEAEQKVAEAERLEEAAAEHRQTAEHFRDESDDLTRRADLADPDVRTDDEGYRLDEDGHRVDADENRLDHEEEMVEDTPAVSEEEGAEQAATVESDENARRRGEEPGLPAAASVAGAFGLGAAELSADDDEDDLADHENPFAESYASEEPAPYASEEPAPYASEEPAPYAQDEPETESAAEADADWVNGPVDESEEPPVPAPGEPDWINGPSDGDSDDAERATADAEVPRPHDEPMAEPMGAEAVPPSDLEEPDPTAGPVEGDDTPALRHEEDVLADEEDILAQADPEGYDVRDDAEGPRESSIEEVRDGGYGMGSAAPIEGGVQPLGHGVKAHRDSMRFVEPGEEGYDDLDPDVWFYDEDAARRAGFRRRGED